MMTFEIKHDGCLNGKRRKGKRTTIRTILNNLLEKTGCDPCQFEVNVSPDGRKVATITGDGCQFRNMDSRDLTVSVVVGGEHFVAKLHSKTYKPQTLNQDIRRALGTSGKAEFQFVGDQVCEKVKPKPSDKPQPKPQPPAPQAPVMKPINAPPDSEQPILAAVNILAAHMAIYKEIGTKKEHPFTREEAQDWIGSHGITISHHTVTGRLLGNLIRRGLYTKDQEQKVWSMTPLGVEVALGQQTLPADETPKKPRKKRAGSKPVEPPDNDGADNNNGAVADDEESQPGELTNLLAIAGGQADNVKDLVATCDRLKAIEAEQSILLADKEKLIARLRENSAGVLVEFLQGIGLV
jgi:hypothetical protein